MANPYNRQFNEGESVTATLPGAVISKPGVNPFLKYVKAPQPPAQNPMELLPEGAVLLPEDSEPAHTEPRDPMALLPKGATLLPEEPAPKQDKQNPFAKYLTADYQAPAATQASAPSKQPDSEGWRQYLAGIARSVAQGATFNWADEIEAVARTMFGGDTAMTRAVIRDEIAKFQKRHPYVAMGAELAGAVAIPGAAGARAGARLAGAGAGLVRRAAAGGTMGAGEGALAGAGSAEGAVAGDDGSATARGAITGGGVGAIVGAAIPGAGHVVGRMLEGAGGKANRLLHDALRNDATLAGRTQTNATEHVRDAAARDVLQQPLTTGTRSEAVLGTLGEENVRRLAREAAESSVEAQAMARRHVESLEASRPGGAEFSHVYARPPVTSPLLDALVQSRPAVRAANAAAMRNLADMGVPTQPGSFSIQHIHQLDQNLRDQSQRLWSNRQTARAIAVDDARDQLRRIIANEAPELARIQARYAHGSEHIRRAPDATEVRATDPAASFARSALGAGVSLTMGHKTSALQRIAHWAVAGHSMSPRVAEALMEKLTTRARDAADFDRLMDAIDNMSAPKRSVYLAAALAADRSGAVAGNLERNSY
jgi:hypothetical protein